MSLVDSKMLPKLQVIVLLLALSKTMSGYKVEVSFNCFQCLCEATIGNEHRDHCNTADWFCHPGDLQCGPFAISQQYWEESGSPAVQPHIGTPRSRWLSCVIHPLCAKRVLGERISKVNQDCNGDGQINCDDYVQMHIDRVVNYEDSQCYPLDATREHWYHNCKTRLNNNL